MHYGTLNNSWSTSDTSKWPIIYCRERDWFPSQGSTGLDIRSYRPQNVCFWSHPSRQLEKIPAPEQNSHSSTWLSRTGFGSSHHLVSETLTQTSSREFLPAWEIPCWQREAICVCVGTGQTGSQCLKRMSVEWYPLDSRKASSTKIPWLKLILLEYTLA